MLITCCVEWWKGNGDRAGMWYGIGGCSELCPAATGHNWVALFPCPCQLRTVRCMDPGQVTDLLIPSIY
jgi:hypothetical protein